MHAVPTKLGPRRSNRRTPALRSPAYNLRSSSTQDSGAISSLFSPTPKGFAAHNVAGHGPKGRRRLNFAVFEDSAMIQQNDHAAAAQYGSGDILRNPLTQQPTASTYPPLDFGNIPTLHPAHSQNTRTNSRYMVGTATSNPDTTIGVGQENFNWGEVASYDGAHMATNPLGWHMSTLTQSLPGPFNAGLSEDNVFHNFGRLGQPQNLVSLDRNPLNFSMGQFGRGEGMQLGQSSNYRQLPISPERTYMDHELEAFNLGRSLVSE